MNYENLLFVCRGLVWIIMALLLALGVIALLLGIKETDRQSATCSYACSAACSAIAVAIKLLFL